ncbi:MAG: PQQ-dependent sugar dehydrogenase [Gammaproteobacteria bacterium]
MSLLRMMGRLATVFIGLSFAQPALLYAQIPPGVTLEPLVNVTGQPIAIRNAGDGSGRLFIVRRSGDILVFSAGNVLAEPFLDINTLVNDTGGEQGLLGLAFHPDYANNGFFYVNYIRAATPLDRTVIARYHVAAANPNKADPNSAQVLLEIDQDFANHNGGNLLFGPDGYLYIGMGDGGSGNDPNNRAQNLHSLLGKMLRIDVNGTPPPPPNDLCGINPKGYGIPPNNPFRTIWTDGFEQQPAVQGDGSCDEIWAWGMRNPWRWSFDRLTGDLLIGDVGQNAVEEIDFQPAASHGGENYGWRCREGNIANGNVPPCTGAFVEPILTYGHDVGRCSVTGGYRYRGTYAPLQGTYIYGDFCTGEIWFATRAGNGVWSSTLWQDTDLRISTFGEDENGNLYVASLDDVGNGQIFRIKTP